MIDFKKDRRILIGIVVVCTAVFLFEVYTPKSLLPAEAGLNGDIVYYTLEKGSSFNDVSEDLAKMGLIHNALFFNIYSIFSLKYSKLQAGNYELSQSMSIAQIVDNFASGGIVQQKITIIEGWNLQDIAENLETEGIYLGQDFINETKKDFSKDQSTCIASARPSTQDVECSGFAFLKDKPKNMDLEGYIFPDTYYLSENSLPEELLEAALKNFDKKLTQELKQEIEKQGKSIFKIVTMASMIEKEVASLEDKKIVSGILWKRIKEGIPLQVDATVNYVTGKHDEKVRIEDTKVDSPYNTYKYYGLPKGPISNPGLDSIIAAIYPEESLFWYYLSADEDGTTIFSRTLDEHIEAQAKYFKP